MRRFGAILFAACSLATITNAAELNPAAVTYRVPVDIEWKAPVAGAGVRQAVLVGDPSKPGLYVQLTKWLPGSMSRPHFHNNNRYFVVLQGTWWVGTGNRFDPNETVPMRAGTHVTHFANGVHYDGAKDEEAIIMIIGEGPVTTTRAEAQ
jgi:oxalate decarboxylase/phosphoglucose isomerase-like protein (cupin superfamily)